MTKPQTTKMKSYILNFFANLALLRFYYSLTNIRKAVQRLAKSPKASELCRHICSATSFASRYYRGLFFGFLNLLYTPTRDCYSIRVNTNDFSRLLNLPEGSWISLNEKEFSQLVAKEDRLNAINPKLYAHIFNHFAEKIMREPRKYPVFRRVANFIWIAKEIELRYAHKERILH